MFVGSARWKSGGVSVVPKRISNQRTSRDRETRMIQQQRLESCENGSRAFPKRGLPGKNHLVEEFSRGWRDVPIISTHAGTQQSNSNRKSLYNQQSSIILSNVSRPEWS